MAAYRITRVQRMERGGLRSHRTKRELAAKRHARMRQLRAVIADADWWAALPQDRRRYIFRMARRQDVDLERLTYVLELLATGVVEMPDEWLEASVVIDSTPP